MPAAGADPQGVSMESTPLELYETAYRFHYQENRIQDAVNYYQKLIKEFPDSNECGYSVIQLQKIKAHDVARSLSDGTESAKTSAFHPLIPITLIFAFIASGVLGLMLYSLDKKLSLEKSRVSLALDALGKISRRDNDAALATLSELKKLGTADIAAWELSADIYRKQHKFDEARNEYGMFFRLNPYRKPTESEKSFMELTDAKTEKVAVPPAIPDPTPPPAPSPVAAGQGKKRLTVPAPPAPLRGSKTKILKPPAPGSAKLKNGPYIVNRDSISYF
jgi:tetratricopeptide (TPR) repeat protein